MTAAAGWDVCRVLGDAGCLHQRQVPDPARRLVWVFEAVHPALVLGSTQSADLVDAEAARQLDIAVVRRRSGGGAVLVVPGNTVWIDVVVPAGDPLWDDDVGRAAHWLGETWRATLDELGLPGADVHRGPLACGPLGRLVCFATVGAGEVTLDGRKVVGVSQRRTRHAARFQSALYREWDPSPLARLLRLDDAGRAAVDSAAIGTGRDGARVVETFLRHLPV
jgi:lipoate---protein ligase